MRVEVMSFVRRDPSRVRRLQGILDRMLVKIARGHR